MPIARIRKVLRDATLQALPPAKRGQRYVCWDADLPGFGVRVTDRRDAHGRAVSRTFIVAAPQRVPGEAHPLVIKTIGRYTPPRTGGGADAPGMSYARGPGLTLAEARERARVMLDALYRGEHPDELEARRAREAAAGRENTVASCVAEYLASAGVTRLRSRHELEVILRRNLLGQRRKNGEWHELPSAHHWRATPITAIDQAAVRDLLRRVAGRGARYQSAKVFAAVRRLFNWALEEKLYGLERNPCDHTKLKNIAGELKARTRTLNNAELKRVWQVANAEGYPHGDVIRLLLLTGQRVGEIARLRWREVDLQAATLTIPAERMKNRREHTVPLTLTALEIVKAALPHRDPADYVFSSGFRPLTFETKFLRRFRAELGEMPHFVLHDLRRTTRTRLSDLGVPTAVAELVIAHVRGDIPVVYDLHRVDAEKRDALSKWEVALLGIVAPQPAAPVAE